MSYVEMFVVEPNGNVTRYAEVPRAWGWQVAIWEYLVSKYGRLVVRTPGAFGFMERYNALWKLFNTDHLSYADDVLLGSTFDRAWVRRETVPVLIEGLRAVGTRTTLAMISELETMMLEHPEMRGAAFNASVQQAFWSRIYEGEQDTKGRPFNLDRDGSRGELKAWEVWQTLESRKSHGEAQNS